MNKKPDAEQELRVGVRELRGNLTRYLRDDEDASRYPVHVFRCSA